MTSLNSRKMTVRINLHFFHYEIHRNFSFCSAFCFLSFSELFLVNLDFQEIASYQIVHAVNETATCLGMGWGKLRQGSNMVLVLLRSVLAISWQGCLVMLHIVLHHVMLYIQTEAISLTQKHESGYELSFASCRWYWAVLCMVVALRQRPSKRPLTEMKVLSLFSTVTSYLLQPVLHLVKTTSPLQPAFGLDRDHRT